jgi:CPA2 family monovalent cation:H+ antiporter-2
MDLVRDLTLVILAGLAGGLLAQLGRQPLLVGYIFAGIVVGPFTGGATVQNVHDVEQLSEIGVALLLFSLGLELSFRELTPVRAVAIFGTIIQLALTAALGAAAAAAFGWTWQEAVWVGALVSLSSTMVVLKTLQSQGRIGTLSSHVMLGMLIAQDLAVVPLMIALPELTRGSLDVPRLGIALGKAAFFLAAVVFVGSWATRRLLALVARWNSRELFLLTTTAVALGIGYLSSTFGLSLAIGAFVAGLVVNESDYAHQALSDVIPLRDLFGLIFFVSVGMLLDPQQMWEQRWTIGALVLIVLVGKSVIVAGVVRAFGYKRIVPIAAGLTLFQAGEFAFVLARAGVASGTLSAGVAGVVLNTALATMVLTPLVSGLSPRIYARAASREKDETFQASNVPRSGLTGHVVVAGAGRVGLSVTSALSQLGLPFVIVELDDRRAQHARDRALPVVYGDATRPAVLRGAGLETARALLVTVPFAPDVRAIVKTARELQPGIPVVVRAEGPEAAEELRRLRVDEVVSPQAEAAIEMTTQALMRLDLPAQQILHVAGRMRRERAGEAEASRAPHPFHKELVEVARQLDFQWVMLPPGSPMDGRRIGELRIRTVTGAVVVAVFHRGQLDANPEADYRLREGDLIAVIGTREQVARFEQAAGSDAPA